MAGGGGEVDEGGRLERRGAGSVEGWQMPEGFIRLEGGCEQFLWKSIRLKHRRASNPGLAPHSLSYGSAIFASRWFLCSLHPSSPFNSPAQLAPAPVPAPAPSYSLSPLVFLRFLSDSSSLFCLSCWHFLLSPRLSVKQNSH